MLYRGYKTRPFFYLPKLRKEHAQLEGEFMRVGGSSDNFSQVLNAAQTMGTVKFTRLVALRKISGKHFFTDDYKIAREFAGPKGFVIRMNVPDDVATKHFQGTQVTAPAGEARYVSNFVFTGDKLANNISEWKIDLIELESMKKKS